MGIKIYKVELTHSNGQYARPRFIEAPNLTSARLTAKTLVGRYYTIRSITEDTSTIKPKLFQVTYCYTHDDGYGECKREHHKGFVKAHSEKEAWAVADLLSQGADHWVEYLNEIKVTSLNELITYLSKYCS